MDSSLCACAYDARKYGFIWLGAAISMAEIEAGLYCAGQPLAVISGHLLGGVLLYFAGLMGARLRQNGMECTRNVFGSWGMRFFAIANILQLIGWTAVMLSQGAAAAHALLPSVPSWEPSLILGSLVILWVFIGLRSFSWIAAMTMLILLSLTVLLSVRITSIPHCAVPLPSATSFWEVFELSMAMPLSWLPLIADYTKDAIAPRTASAASTIIYSAGSLWMYFLGIGLASIQASTLAEGIQLANIGLWGLLVIIFSTVTTTYLDTYSGGESIKSILHKIPPKIAAVGVCLLGLLLSIAGIMERYTNFLYMISSLFLPMAVAMLAEQFLFHHHKPFIHVSGFVTGFVLYHANLYFHFSPIGPSLTAILGTLIMEASLAVMTNFQNHTHVEDR